MPRPLCFMVMPYGRKPTSAEAGKGPAEVDFNALWDLAYVPVITELGYEAVRADQDTGAMIITQMLERLYFADLVLADMTIPNGNVYYEIGIRHAAKARGCVLMAADWSHQLFDVAQMRTLRYPLSDGNVPPSTALGVQRAIRDAIPKLAQGSSPMHESIKGYPANVDSSAASSMKEQMTRLAAFQGAVRAVRAAPVAERMQQALALVDLHGKPPMTATVAIALLRLLRDCVREEPDWLRVVTFIDGLPEDLAALEEFREQRALALSNTGRHLESIAELEALLATSDPTPERLGLLGGRYKRLLRIAQTREERAQALSKAIAHYERGMELDLNEYFCSSNLPRLYRLRGRKGDDERAQSVLRIVIAACERARKRDATDRWLRPTLLAAAFDAGDAEKAEALVEEIADEGPARWQIESVRGDLDTSIGHLTDEATRKRLNAVMAAIDRMRA